MQDLEFTLLQLSLGGCVTNPELHQGAAPEVAAAAGPEPDLLSLTTSGRWVDVLRHPSTQILLGAHDKPQLSGPADYYAWLQAKLQGNSTALSLQQGGAAAQPLLLAAVACLNIFLQQNLTGPLHGVAAPPLPLELFTPLDCRAAGPAADPASAAGSMHPHDRWAAAVLQLDGEELLGRFSSLQYLLLAELLLLAPLLHTTTSATSTATQQPSHFCDLLQQQDPTGRKGQRPAPGAEEQPAPSAAGAMLVLEPAAREAVARQLPSWMWWALRATSLHQNVLACRSPTLLRRSALIMTELLAWSSSSGDPPTAAASAPSPGLTSGSGPSDSGAPAASGLSLDGRPTLQGALYIEMALMQYGFGYIEPGKRYLEQAGRLLGLEVELTGALGRRTVHQIDAKAQLVVVATRNRRAGQQGQQQEEVAGRDRVGLGLEPDTRAAHSSGKSEEGEKETVGLEEQEDVLIAPVLIGEDGQQLDSHYSGLEQAMLLAWCTHVKKGTARDELQAWQMAPYVEAVLSQGRSHFMLQASAMLHKLRHERTRSRTRERALLRAELLAEALALAPGAGKDKDATAATAAGDDGACLEAVSRLRYAFTVWFPLQVVFKKELAEQYISMGFIGAALKSLEELELWDNLIMCYRLLEKKSQAEELIRRRLQVTPDEPRLWNALGDLHMDDAHYREAWERSGHKNARSQRSLGRSALNRKAWAEAAQHFERAVALNPMHVDSWFSLGYSHVKADQPEQALRAFTRVTQNDPDHGEAWNNMAALWMRLERFKEAFSALSECIKHKRDSWQVWENYAVVAVRSRNFLAAARGFRQVLELSGGQRLKVEVLEGLVEALEKWGVGAEGEGGPEEEEEQAREGEEEISDLFLPGLPMLSGVALPGGGEEGEEAAAAAAAVRQQQQEQRDEAGRLQLQALVGGLLKQAVNSSCCTPQVWGLLGRWNGLQGEVEAKKEAFLKQVRGLATTAFKSDEGHFQAMARASLDLCRAYVELYEAGRAASSGAGAAVTEAGAAAARPAGAPGGVRDLAAARMHLRGVLKQCEPSFAEHSLFGEMQALLERVVQLEAEAAPARPPREQEV